MAQARKVVTDFTGGEVSDRLMARIDSPLYAKTCRTLENFIVHASGGADLRPGTYYCGAAKTNTGKVRLIPFVATSGQGYVLELSDYLMRVWKDGALVQSGGTDLEVVTPWGEDDLFSLDWVQQEDTLFMGHKTGQLMALQCGADDSWTFSDVTSGPALAVAHTTTPFVTIYQYDSDVFTKVDNPADLPGGNGIGTSFSSDGVYLVTACGTTPYINIYKRSGSTFTKLSDPADIPTGAAWDCDFSPDGVYLAVSHFVSPYVTIYKHSGDTFTKLANPVDLPASNGKGCAFSSDGTYLVIGHPSSPYITIYKRDGDVFTKLANPATLPAADAYKCAFSPDDLYLAVPHGTSPYLTIYKRSGDTFTKLANPANLPAGDAYGCAFSSNGVYLAVAHTTTPFVTIYKRSGDQFTKLANPGNLPTSTGRQCSFSPNDLYLAVIHNDSPYVTIYKRTDDTFAKLANPGTLPTGHGFGGSFVSDPWMGVSWGVNYPASLTFHDQRLVLGHGARVRGSAVGSPSDFTIDAADSATGFEYELATDLLEDIVWLRSKDHRIVVGGVHGELLLSGGDAPITGANIYVDRASGHGSAAIRPTIANESLLYVQKGGQRLREFMFSQERGGYISPDLTQLADHIGAKGFKELAWQRSPRSILWCVMNDGELCSLTLDRNSNIVAWARHPTDGLVESAAVIPGTDEDVVYLLVKRTIDEASAKYIEKLMTINRPADADDYFFVDCGLTILNTDRMEHGDCETTDAPHVLDDGSSLTDCTFARNSTQKYAGSFSFKLTKTVAAGSAGFAYLTDSAATDDMHGFVAGKTYSMRLRVYIPTTGGFSDVTELKIQMKYYVEGDGWSAENPAASKYDEWEELEISSFTIPETATAVVPLILMESTAANGEFCYIDSIELWREVDDLAHLEGEDVAIYADGEELEQGTVDDGAIELDRGYDKIQVGLPYTGTLETQLLGNFSQVRVPEGVLLLYKTRGGKIGPSSTSLKAIQYPADEVVTGPQEVRIGGSFSRQGSVTIVQDQPYPMTVLGLVADMSVDG